MITTLSGANSYGLLTKLRELTLAFVEANDELAVERLDGQETELANIKEALTGLPFLASKKLVILREPGAIKKFAEYVEQILGNVPEANDVIIVEPKLDKRQNYFKYLKKSTDFQEFDELDQNGLSRWLVETAKEQKGSISPGDARYLVERVGQNQQLLSNELEKLLIYNPKITRQGIDLLTEQTPQSTIFQLLDAAFAGQIKKTLDIYVEQRALKIEPQQIIAMLTWQLHVLAIIKAAGDRPIDQIAKEAKINPFVLRKSQSIARKLTLRQVRNLVDDLLKIDIAIKTTSIDADEALQHYLIKLANI